MKYVAIFIFTVTALFFMAGALHVGRYRRRGKGCCAGKSVKF